MHAAEFNGYFSRIGSEPKREKMRLEAIKSAFLEVLKYDKKGV